MTGIQDAAEPIRTFDLTVTGALVQLLKTALYKQQQASGLFSLLQHSTRSQSILLWADLDLKRSLNHLQTPASPFESSSGKNFLDLFVISKG
jgi:hypothetical protein